MRNLFLMAGCLLHFREYARLDRWKAIPADFHNGGVVGRDFFAQNWHPSVRCIADMRIGPAGDDGVWLCDPDCLLIKHNCTVFVIGSSTDFVFEHAISGYGCNTHTFDHTLPDVTVPDHVTLHRIGASIKSTNNLAKIESMFHIANMSSDKKIDILRLDCEGCEYLVLKDPATLLFLANHVVQLQVEIHFKGSQETEALAQALTDAGFRVFAKEPNLKWSDGGCIEYALVNTRLLFF